MQSALKKRSKKTGMIPGSLIHIGDTYVEKPKVRIIRYNENLFEEREGSSDEDFAGLHGGTGNVWMNIDGLQDVKLLENVGHAFDLHPLILEDILNTDQRPKIEDLTDYLYIVLRNFHNHESGTLYSEQVSIVLGKDFILSFQEKESPLFAPVLERLRIGKGKIRRAGPDYLVHALIDNVVDHYFIVLEDMGESIERLENDLLRQTTPSELRSIHSLKRDLIFLRKSLWPLRETLSALQRSDSALIDEPSAIYFKDVFDHVIAIIDTVDTFRDMLSGMLDIYLSSVSIKLNEVMKVLTIIATIFMPLTFLAGVYGMNFKHMPELEWYWGYFGILALMLTVAVVMLIFFRRKKWI
ncbi:MAG: magnesium/cobalt transporter CorA [Smithellaceae bacterium]